MSLKNKIEKIIKAIQNTDINHIEITSFWGFQKIKLSKDSNDNLPTTTVKNKEYEEENVVIDKKNDIPKSNDNIDKDIEQKEVVEDVHQATITAPLVGTFYASAKPGDPAFIQVGSDISKGAPVCIIEAMKIFNTIESEVEGRITDILVEDGEPVEFGQALFTIKEN